MELHLEVPKIQALPSSMYQSIRYANSHLLTRIWVG